MITVNLNAVTQTTGNNRSCPDIARKLILEGADPSTEIEFTRDGRRSYPLATLAWWSEVQHVRSPQRP